jgi:hydroxyacylglutathione hydrolase
MNAEEIAKNVWKLSGNSNFYILSEMKIAIDAGESSDFQAAEKAVKKIIEPSKIRQVFFTHLHYDHIGNYQMFSNAKFYASGAEIKFLEKDRLGAVMNIEASKNFSAKLLPAEDELLDSRLSVIETPGHTPGSVCYFLKEKGILFSGDTIFSQGYGRTDFPGGSMNSLRESIRKIKGLEYKMLMPGHDY